MPPFRRLTLMKFKDLRPPFLRLPTPNMMIDKITKTKKRNGNIRQSIGQFVLV